MRVRLKIFDLQGRLVRSLADAVYGPGRWSAAWDRLDDSGGVAPSGVYLYRIEAGQFQSRGKMVLIP